MLANNTLGCANAFPGATVSEWISADILYQYYVRNFLKEKVIHANPYLNIQFLDVPEMRGRVIVKGHKNFAHRRM